MSDLTTRIFRETLATLEDNLNQEYPIKADIEECLDLLLKLIITPVWHSGRTARLEVSDIRRVAGLETSVSALRAVGIMTLYSNLVGLLEPNSGRLELNDAFGVLSNPSSSVEQVLSAQGLITDTWDHEGLDLTDEQLEIILDFNGVRSKDFKELSFELLPKPSFWEEPAGELVTA